MNKNETISILNNHLVGTGAGQKNTHYATVLNYGDRRGWWINIPFEKFQKDIYIILQSDLAQQFLVLYITGNAIHNPRTVFRDKDGKADIFIEVNNEYDLTSTIPIEDSQSSGSRTNLSQYVHEVFNFLGHADSGKDFPNEVENLIEGKKKQVFVNSYERNSVARLKCIGHYGLNCTVCGFNFEEKYGELGKGFIQVHHIIALADSCTEYVVDPIVDLRPVCPNCHAMLHRKGNISINELINQMK